jgi:hypothetical protein
MMKVKSIVHDLVNTRRDTQMHTNSLITTRDMQIVVFLAVIVTWLVPDADVVFLAL